MYEWIKQDNKHILTLRVYSDYKPVAVLVQGLDKRWYFTCQEDYSLITYSDYKFEPTALDMTWLDDDQASCLDEAKDYVESYTKFCIDDWVDTANEILDSWDEGEVNICP